jgi:hypothetical protein
MAVTLSASRTLPPGSFLALVSVRGCAKPRAIVRSQGLGKLKKSDRRIPEPDRLHINIINIIHLCNLSVSYQLMSPFLSFKLKSIID